MPTIKTKKEMNLPELIEWGWKNGIEKRSFISNGGKVTANFEDMGHFITDSYISKDVTFTVEIEELITEDTVIPKMVSIGRENQNETNIHYSRSIGQFLDNEDFNYYVLNDDDTLTLIWRDGKLVE
ncbi:hypothetical protein G6W75_10005 [Staphylococcus sciuri]|uniref:hypothetical protein n=1 Tax=Mammaliicoccus sciuri TaxID=1296 RepID=UPI0013E9066C|nr:hypothetical protein [Mammaliicoccus sciuri]NGX76423.1 hypothetical protein [Mammaliicoccus sciuri]